MQVIPLGQVARTHDKAHLPLAANAGIAQVLLAVPLVAAGQLAVSAHSAAQYLPVVSHVWPCGQLLAVQGPE